MTHVPHVQSSTMYNSQDKEATRMHTHKWMDKAVVETYSGIALSHKTEWNNAIWSNVDGFIDYHVKWNKIKTNIIRCYLHVESKKWYRRTYL